MSVARTLARAKRVGQSSRPLQTSSFSRQRTLTRPPQQAPETALEASRTPIRHFAASRSNSVPTSVHDNPASRPYARHRPTLPQPASYRWPIALLLGFSLLSWSAFTIHATNRERLSSSVLKNVIDRIKTSPTVAQTLGDEVNLKREMILAGDPYIRGSVNIMQGRVDMSFKLKGSKDSGTAYFSAIRREPGQPYETLRFLVVLDSTGETISLLDEE